MRIEWAENPLATKVILTSEETDELTIEDRAWCLESLQGVHDGDCVKVSGACSKCLVEDDIGVNTLEGLSGYTPCWIEIAFRHAPGIDQAIAYLEDYPADSVENKELAERWKSETAIAAAELKHYRDKHKAKQGGDSLVMVAAKPT